MKVVEVRSTYLLAFPAMDGFRGDPVQLTLDGKGDVPWDYARKTGAACSPLEVLEKQDLFLIAVKTGCTSMGKIKAYFEASGVRCDLASMWGPLGESMYNLWAVKGRRTEEQVYTVGPKGESRIKQLRRTHAAALKAAFVVVARPVAEGRTCERHTTCKIQTPQSDAPSAGSSSADTKRTLRTPHSPAAAHQVLHPTAVGSPPPSVTSHKRKATAPPSADLNAAMAAAEGALAAETPNEEQRAQIKKRIEALFMEAYPEGVDITDAAVAQRIPEQQRAFERAAMDEWKSDLRQKYEAVQAAVAAMMAATPSFTALPAAKKATHK